MSDTPEEDEEGKLTGDDLKDAKKNKEAARQWISGIGGCIVAS